MWRWTSLLLAAPLAAQTVLFSPCRLVGTPAVPGRTWTATLASAGDAGAPYYLALDVAAASQPLPLPGIGELGLALTPAFAFVGAGRLDARGQARLALALPKDPNLLGATVYLQGLVLTARRPSGGILSNLLRTRVRAAEGHETAPGRMQAPRALHTLTPLPDGRVLIVGGGNGTVTSPQGTRVAELFYPWLETFDLTRDSRGNPTQLTALRAGHTATLLRDGRVLIAGGVDSQGNVTAAAEVFDPRTGRFTRVGNLVRPRALHTATLLPNGEVLLAGGTTAPFTYPGVFGGATNTTEIFNPVTNTFRPGPAMLSKRMVHSAAAIQVGGRHYVMMLGGIDGLFLFLFPRFTASVEVYDVAAGRFTRTVGNVTVGNLAVARAGLAAVPLPGGGVLAVGGANGATFTAVGTVERWSPSSGRFTTVGTLQPGRALPALTVLLDGRVLIQGGATGSLLQPGATAECLLYEAGRLRRVGPLRTGRGAHGAALLPGGAVAVIGGADSKARVLASAEMYTP